MQYGPDPSPEQCRSDDEEKLLKPVADKEQSGKTGDFGEDGDMGPKVADWRFGPAQIWYDILGVPETGDGFNYGFKVAEEKVRFEHILNYFKSVKYLFYNLYFLFDLLIL